VELWSDATYADGKASGGSKNGSPDQGSLKLNGQIGAACLSGSPKTSNRGFASLRDFIETK